MASKNAARIYHQVEQAHAQQQRQTALSHPRGFIKQAATQGYTLTMDNFEHQLSQLSDEEVASILNPGISPRRHLFPR